jgi:hypothetical protein
VATRFHKATNSARSSVVSPFRRLRSRTQLLSSIAEQTVRFFLIVLANSRGAISRGLFPCSHLDPQKLAFLPFPKVICVQFAKRRLSVSSQGTSVPAKFCPGTSIGAKAIGGAGLAKTYGDQGFPGPRASWAVSFSSS